MNEAEFRKAAYKFAKDTGHTDAEAAEIVEHWTQFAKKAGVSAKELREALEG